MRNLYKLIKYDTYMLLHRFDILIFFLRTYFYVFHWIPNIYYLCVHMFLGDFGSYQLRQFLLHLMSAFTAGLHMMVLVTVAAVPEYKYYTSIIILHYYIFSWQYFYL